MMGARKTQAQLLGELIVTVNGIADRVGEIKAQLKEGDEKFEEHASQIGQIKLECVKRGVNCPSLHRAAERDEPQSIPMKYIGTGIVFVAASVYGLVVIVAKFLDIDLPWPF